MDISEHIVFLSIGAFISFMFAGFHLAPDISLINYIVGGSLSVFGMGCLCLLLKVAYVSINFLEEHANEYE